jgi:hypothetical protein
MKLNRGMLPGMAVLCLDNTEVENVVTKNSLYIVKEVSHRGALIQVEGVNTMLAASRFTPSKPEPGEVNNERNR